MNGWEITTVSANGNGSSQATVITRNSPSMVVNVITSCDIDTAVQLPVSPTVGDFVDVCLGSTLHAATVWIGTTVLDSSTSHFDALDPGKCRLYRYISGSFWNRYD